MFSIQIVSVGLLRHLSNEFAILMGCGWSKKFLKYKNKPIMYTNIFTEKQLEQWTY